MSIGQATPAQDTSGTRSVPAQLAPEPLNEGESIDQSLEKSVQEAGLDDAALDLGSPPAAATEEGQEPVQATDVGQTADQTLPQAVPEATPQAAGPEVITGLPEVAAEPAPTSATPLLDALAAAGQQHNYPDEATAIRAFTELRQKVGEHDQEVQNWRSVEPIIRDPAFQQWWRQGATAPASVPQGGAPPAGAPQGGAPPAEAPSAEADEPDYGFDFGSEYDPELEGRIKPEVDPETGQPTGNFTGGTPAEIQQVSERWPRVNAQWRDWQNNPSWLGDDLVRPIVQQEIRQYHERVSGQQQDQADLHQTFQANQHVFVDRTNPQQLGFTPVGRAFVDMVREDGLAPQAALARLTPVIQASGQQPVVAAGAGTIPAMPAAAGTPAVNPPGQAPATPNVGTVAPGAVPGQQPPIIQPGGMVTPAGSSAAVAAGAGQASPQVVSRRAAAPRAEQRDFRQMELDEVADLTAMEGGVDMNALPV